MCEDRNFRLGYCIIARPYLPMTNHPWKGCSQSHIDHFQFWGPSHYLWNDRS